MPSGTAIARAMTETSSDPTKSGTIPYQSCQKLAVSHSRPKRKPVSAL